MLAQTIQSLQLGHYLTNRQSQDMLNNMLDRDCPSEQIAGCMILLNQQLDNSAMLTGIAQAMRSHMKSVTVAGSVMDVVGTGGDGADTVNISTGTALLLAACGVKVAKHGNRAVSSACGSADVLQNLGCSIEQSPQQIAQAIQVHGFGFCYAPYFHHALQHLKAIRRSLAVPTVFNLMGPLLNPAGADHLMIGVHSEHLLEPFAQTLAHLPISRALVFHSGGLDELSCAAAATAYRIEGKVIQPLTLDAQDVGLPRCSLSDLTGGDADYNAQLIRQALAGEHTAIAHTLMFNAGVGLHLYGVTGTIAEGVGYARHIINKGQALQLLSQLTNRKVS